VSVQGEGSPKLIAGNWKMNGTLFGARQLAGRIVSDLALVSPRACEVVVCPPFPHLAAVADSLRGSRVALGAQDVHWAPSGAYTGEVSAPMLREIGCTFVIVGHSERRTLLGDGPELVRRKLEAALAHDLVPILCVGESQEERDAGRTNEVLDAQLRSALSGIVLSPGVRLEIAYEPVWAIGTGRTATPAMASDAHRWIRSILEALLPPVHAGATRVVYGGSVKADNAAELLHANGIDGALVGGASLDASAFLAIAEASRRPPARGAG
jgi:triosephosphate isomerase